MPLAARAAAYGGFARITGVDVSEQRGVFADYESMGDYFARPLKDGVRTWDAEPDTLPAACDGQLASCTSLRSGQLPIIKGHTYSLREFLGADEQAERFENGSQYTIYLSPKDYHRVHSPVSGTVERIVRLGSDLWPVRPDVLDFRPSSFVDNERVLFFIRATDGTRYVVAMVGATVVGSVRPARSEQPPYRVELGDELGQFRLGSTAVVIGEKPFIPLGRAALSGVIVRMGEGIARFVSNETSS